MSSESSPTLETAECNKLLDTLLNNAGTPKPASVLAAGGLFSRHIFYADASAVQWKLLADRTKAAWTNSSSKSVQVLRYVVSTLHFPFPTALYMRLCPYNYYRTKTSFYFNHSNGVNA